MLENAKNYLKNNQNFMPLYIGQEPSFIKKDDSGIYVLDNKALMPVFI
jgi:hypothetical protein